MKPDIHALFGQHRPNDPIFLEDISVTHINDLELPEPFEAGVRLHFHPQVVCRIESDQLPRQLVRLGEEAFHITTARGVKIKVLPTFRLNDWVYSDDCFRGSLIPLESPCMTVQPDREVISLGFSVLNFQTFFGRNDKWIEFEGSCRRLGSSESRFDGFRYEILENPYYSKHEELLNQNDGYTVTHTGVVERCDGEAFSVARARDLLRAIRGFLSFARGAACGLTLVKATMRDGKDEVFQWGTTHTEPWLRGGSTWLPSSDGGDVLAELFPRFLSLCDGPDCGDTILNAIDWYLNTTGTSLHAGIVLAQAALESLSHMVLEGKKRNGSPSKKIREAIESLGISSAIPGSCLGLKNWMVEARQHSNRELQDGLRAIIEMRNDLVHADRKFPRIPSQALSDALRLSKWFIEMMIFKRLGYVGRYRNRVSESGIGAIESVPWANEDSVA